MSEIDLLASVIAGVICFGAGLLAWSKSPNSLPAGLFLAAMFEVFFALFTGSIYSIIDPAYANIANAIAKISVISFILALTFIWQLALVFPLEREVSFRPPNLLGGIMMISVVAAVVAGSTATVDYSNLDAPDLSDNTMMTLVITSVAQVAAATSIAFYTLPKVDKEGKKSAMIFLLGVWIFVAVGALSSMDPLYLSFGVGTSGVIFAVSIARGDLAIVIPAPEKLMSSAKSKYKLLHKRVYLVEETKPDFSMKMFADIIKGRCYDCESDESFPCESLDCNACGLPCPCRDCKKYAVRTQGFVVTRQFPKDLRKKYFLQTTPMLWLSTVAGNENMDPAKLNLLTEYLVNFMEKSPNGVVFVDGLEYLMTSNDFSKVLKSVDRWTETVMTSKSRLILSIDIKAYDAREVAMLERNREVVRPDATEIWRVIPERI